MTDEQKIALADEVLAKQAKQKANDKFYTAKARHDLDELKKVVKEHDLEGDLIAFPESKEDFVARLLEE